MNARTTLALLLILVLTTLAACGSAATEGPDTGGGVVIEEGGAVDTAPLPGSDPVVGGDSGGVIEAPELEAPGESVIIGGSDGATSGEDSAGGSSGGVTDGGPVERSDEGAGEVFLGDSGDVIPAPLPEPGGDIIILPTAPSPNPQPQSGLLTAADIDDNVNYGAWQRYNESQTQYWNNNLGLPFIPTADRIAFRVVTAAGDPVSHAQLKFEWGVFNSVAGETGTNGMFYFYPAFDTGQTLTQFAVNARPANGGAGVTVNVNMGQINYDWNDIIQITLPNASSNLPTEVDIMFVFDTTGSMGDELTYLNTEFRAIVDTVQQLYPQSDLRYGLILYRDDFDQYKVRNLGFTRSADEMQARLAQQEANGGGDYPEAMEAALQEAVNADWRSGNVARIMFLIADAPPHAENYTAMVEQIGRARQAGIHIYPVAASGVAEEAEYLMRMGAALTQGRYIWLTDDSGVGGAHAEPKVACYLVTRLDRLIIRVIASELAGRRVEPDYNEIIRSVGAYQNGLCIPDYQQ